MPTTSQNQQNSAKRLGTLGESLAQSCLLEYADFCYPTTDGHPADLILEISNALYRVQVKTRNESKEGKYTFPLETHRTKSDIHANYKCDLLAFVFMPDKRIIFRANTSNQQYFAYRKKDLVENVEYLSLIESLNSLSSVPVVNSILT